MIGPSYDDPARLDFGFTNACGHLLGLKPLTAPATNLLAIGSHQHVT